MPEQVHADRDRWLAMADELDDTFAQLMVTRAELDQAAETIVLLEHQVEYLRGQNAELRGQIAIVQSARSWDW